MRSVLRLLATDGFALASIDIEFKSSNMILHAFLGKDVEEFFNDSSQHYSVFFRASAPLHVVINFLGVYFWVILDDVVPRWKFLLVLDAYFTVFLE